MYDPQLCHEIFIRLLFSNFLLLSGGGETELVGCLTAADVYLLFNYILCSFLALWLNGV